MMGKRLPPPLFEIIAGSRRLRLAPEVMTVFLEVVEQLQLLGELTPLPDGRALWCVG